MTQINHIHVMAVDPRKTADWYVEMFGAEIEGEMTGWRGTFTMRLKLGGLGFLVTSEAPGETLSDGTAETHYGLDHFGVHSDDIESDMARLESKGVEVLLPITDSPTGAKISYVKAPDNVRIELVQPQA
jgi:catechol 2,3-dioxygenase-like lactoylglutathione lyase family enzyme